MISLGQKIRLMRMEKKMTQTQLAEGLVSTSAISQIETDKITPSYKLLLQIAERLDVSLDYFLSDTEEYLEQTTSHKLAKTFLSAGEHQNAVPILEKLLLNKPNDPELLMDLATCFLHLKNSTAANELLEKVMHLSLKADDVPTYVDSLNKLGLLFYQQNNVALSLHYWQRAYEFLKGNDKIDTFLQAEITTNLAITYSRLGDHDKAARLFEESQQLIQNSTNLPLIARNYLGLGQSFYGKREYKLAEEYCQQAIAIFKNLDHIRYSIRIKENFAILRGENGEPEEALRILHDCLQEYKDHNFEKYTSNAHSEIAKILISLKRYDEAQTHIEQAFATCQPHSVYHAQVYFVRSMLHLALGCTEEAIADAKQAIELFLQSESIHEYNKATLHLSNIYKQLGDYKSSTEILEMSQHSIQNFLREKGVIL